MDTNENDVTVNDIDGDGVINDITETISEFYSSEKGTEQNTQFTDGLGALASLDANIDGVFDANDELFSTGLSICCLFIARYCYFYPFSFYVFS